MRSNSVAAMTQIQIRKGGEAMIKMKCVIRENLESMKLSVRGLAEQAGHTPGAPSYSTIDNFIRKGTGNLETAWAITKLMGLTLNDNFINEDSYDSYLKKVGRDTANAQAVINAILAVIIEHCSSAKNAADTPALLFSIGKTITPLGYPDEAGTIISAGTELIKKAKQKGGSNDEQP